MEEQTMILTLEELKQLQSELSESGKDDIEFVISKQNFVYRRGVADDVEIKAE